MQDVTVNTASGSPRILEIGPVRIGLLGATSSGSILPTGQAGDPAPAVKATVSNSALRSASDRGRTFPALNCALFPRQSRVSTSGFSGITRKESTAAAFSDTYLIEAATEVGISADSSFMTWINQGPSRTPWATQTANGEDSKGSSKSRGS